MSYLSQVFSRIFGLKPEQPTLVEKVQPKEISKSLAIPPSSKARAARSAQARPASPSGARQKEPVEQIPMEDGVVEELLALSAHLAMTRTSLNTGYTAGSSSPVREVAEERSSGSTRHEAPNHEPASRVSDHSGYSCGSSGDSGSCGSSGGGCD